MHILIAFAGVALGYFALRAFVNASPAALAGLLRKGGGAVAILAALALVLRGRVDLALPLGAFGLWLTGLVGGAPAGFRPAGKGGGGVSRVRSALVEMELDHVTGAMRGVVLAGPDEGKPLDSLDRDRLIALYRLCRSDDPDGARLLEAYFDRRFSGWRQTGDAQGDARRAEHGAMRSSGSISEDEAYEILGLEKGAAAADIARAHRDLMKKLHPDLGGTTDLAARVNEAKEVLMRRHH